jgi:hypothetical protein
MSNWFFTNLWFLANPFSVHAMGESDKKRLIFLGARQLPIKPCGLEANPYSGSLPGPN